MVSSLRRQRDAERRRRTRRALMDAAAEVFVAKGYHNALISDIAGRAGTGQGTFYRNFDNKRAVFEALFDEYVASIVGEFSEMSERLPASIDEYMEASTAAIKRAAAVVAANRDLTLLFLRQGPSVDDEFQRRLDAVYLQFAALAGFVLQHAIDAGFARPCDAELVAQSVVGMGRWHMERFLDGRLGDRTIDQVIDELIQFAFWGFGPREEKA